MSWSMSMSLKNLARKLAGKPVLEVDEEEEAPKSYKYELSPSYTKKGSGRIHNDKRSPRGVKKAEAPRKAESKQDPKHMHSHARRRYYAEQASQNS